MSEIKNQILQKLKTDEVKLKPRWLFIIKKIGLWLAISFIIFISGIGFSIILYSIFDLDWEIYGKIENSRLKFLITKFPYLWFGVVFLFITLGLFSFRHTGKGYKFSILTALLFGITSTGILGVFLYHTRTAETLNEAMAKSLPFYKHLSYNRQMAWVRPSKGILAGKIINIKSPEVFVLKDLQGKRWIVSLRKAHQPRKKIKIKEGIEIRIAGERIGEDEFLAEIIRPAGKRPPLILGQAVILL